MCPPTRVLHTWERKTRERGERVSVSAHKYVLLEINKHTHKGNECTVVEQTTYTD